MYCRDATGGQSRGAASHRLEEAQLKLALELSKEQAQAEAKDQPLERLAVLAPIGAHLALAGAARAA